MSTGSTEHSDGSLTPGEVRYAEWRAEIVRPEEDKGLIGLSRPLGFATLAGFVIVQVVALISLGRLILDWQVIVSVVLVSLCIATPILAVAAIFQAIRKQAQKPDDELALRQLEDYPPAVPQIPVSIILRANGCTYGRDRGYLSFLGDLVYFNGLRTDFSLKRREHIGLPKRDHFNGDEAVFLASFNEAFSSSIDLPDLKGELEIRVNAYGDDVLRKFQTEMKTWWDTEEVEAELNPVLPPIKPTLEALSSAYQKAQRLELLAILICLLVALDTRSWIVTISLVIALWAWTGRSARSVSQMSAMSMGRVDRIRYRFFRRPMLLTRWKSLFQTSSKRPT